MFKNLLARRSRILSRSVSPAVDSLESRRLFTAVVGLTAGNELVQFDTATPGTPGAPVAVTGLAGSESLVGIDYRPATGVLYGLGSTGQLYTLNIATGAATAVGSTPLTLNGTNFGFDFNPNVDRIRIVSDADQNFRANPNTGAAVDGDANTVGTQEDGTLAYAAADPNFGVNPNVTGAAYINNFAATGSTTLFVIDTDLDIIATQGTAPGVTPAVNPNLGQLFTVGSLGVDANGVAGFDVSEADGLAYAALNVGGISSLYTINLTTGAATSVGAIGALNLVDISAVPVARTLYALSSTGTSLAVFTTSTLATPTVVNITGLAANDTVASIDFRPATGELWGVGTSGQLYTISPAGVAATVGAGLGTTTIPTIAEIDFNPTVDRIRVIGSGDENARANPNNGNYVDSNTTTDGLQLDTPLAYTGGTPNPNVIAAAYTNPSASATSTTLYAIDADTNFLVTIGSVAGATPAVSPNTGALTNVGTAGLGVNVVSGGLDAAVGGTVYGLFNVDGVTGTGLYAINTTTGAATLVGTLGNGSTTFSDIAISTGAVFNISTATATVAEGAGNLTVTVTRGGDTTGAATVTYTAASIGASTATGGTDYGTNGQTTFAGTVSFADGEASKTFQIPIIQDTTDEANETFTVTLTSPSVGAIGGTGTQTVTITDDENPTVTLNDATVNEGGVLTFTVTLSAASTQTVTVDIASDTTGTAGTNDFTALTTTTLTFAPGETTKTVTIQTTQDATVEPNETLNVLLSNAINADLTADVTGVGTINNDDVAQGLSAGADPVRTGTKNQVLTIQGTSGNDVVVVGAGSGGTITVTLNGQNQTLPSAISKKNLYRIIILGGAGDDEIRVNSKVNYPVEAYGEAGNDFIYGGKQRDLLVGGDGVDSLYGGAGDDILVAGSLNFGNTVTLTATATLLNAWLGKGSFSQRVAAITGAGTGGFSFSSTTVIDDADRDYLFGQGSADLISRNSATQDVVADESNKGRTDTLANPA